MTDLALTFDQVDAGIPAGIEGRARTDIASTGPEGARAYPVQILVTNIPVGATAIVSLLDEPPNSNPLLTQLDEENWTLEFDKGAWGPFRVRVVALNGGNVVASVARRISIRSPVLSLAYPANAERTDPNATSTPTVQSVALTEMNEGGTNRPLVDFHRELVEAVEAGGGGGLPNVTNDAQLKRAANDFSSFAHKSNPIGSDILLAEDSEASGAKKYSSVLEVLTSRVSEAGIVSKINPRNWWNANHTVESGGLVDTLADIGNTPKDFTQAGAARAPIGTDANGQKYLALDGANDYYQAGLASDWTHLHNGTGCTYALIIAKTALATAVEDILGTGGVDSTLAGFTLRWNYVSASDQGPAMYIAGGSAGNFVVYVETTILAASPAVFLVIWRFFGGVVASKTIGGVTSIQDDAQLRVGGHMRSRCARNANVSGSNPTYALTLGRAAAGAANYTAVRIYDAVLDSGVWTDAQCDLFLRYALTRAGA